MLHMHPFSNSNLCPTVLDVGKVWRDAHHGVCARFVSLALRGLHSLPAARGMQGRKPLSGPPCRSAALC